MLNTPILFLIFNRPQQTQQVFQRIREVKPKLLYVAADGPRKGVEGEAARCKLAREIATAVDWDCEVITLFRDNNLGCGRAVSESISWFFETVEEGIILEDDCLVDLTFFSFASSILEKYRDEVNVMHISANGLVKPQRNLFNLLFSNTSYSFVQYPLIWGWATWKRAWEKYDFKLAGWENYGEVLIDQKFSKSLTRAYWRKEFGAVYNKELDTWDYQWLIACLKANGLSVIPKHNLVKNIGFGSDATHFFSLDDIRTNMEAKPIEVKLKHPKRIILNENENLNLEEEIFGIRWKRPFYWRVVNRIKRKINK